MGAAKSPASSPAHSRAKNPVHIPADIPAKALAPPFKERALPGDRASAARGGQGIGQRACMKASRATPVPGKVSRKTTAKKTAPQTKGATACATTELEAPSLAGLRRLKKRQATKGTRREATAALGEGATVMPNCHPRKSSVPKRKRASTSGFRWVAASCTAMPHHAQARTQATS